MLKKVTVNSILKTKFVLQSTPRFLATATIDENEIAHFKKYSPTWWDEMGPMKPLHTLNVLRVPFIRDSLINSGITKKEFIDSSEPLTDLRILDVGCGGGLLTEPLARLGCQVVGVDATIDLIEIAKEHAIQEKLNNITYVPSSIEDFSDKNLELFDAVVASEIIEHVNDKTTFVSECVKCLKPGGSIFITTLSKTLLARIGAICIPEYVLRFIPIGTHEYEKFVEPHVVQRLLEEKMCNTRVIHGMFYNYFTNNWSWMSNTSTSYALHAVKMNTK